LILVLCVSIKEAQNSHGFKFLVAKQNLCGITWQYTPFLGKEKKIIVQRRKGFSLSVFPHPFARNKNNGNI